MKKLSTHTTTAPSATGARTDEIPEAGPTGDQNAVLEMHGSSQDAQGRTRPVAQVHAFFADPVDVVVIYAIVETFFMYSWAVAPA